jgi:UDP-glucose 4-epimerase
MVIAPVIAVTGANGFIGRAICARAATRGRSLRRFVHARPGLREPIEAPGAHAAPGERVPPDQSIAFDLAKADADDLGRTLDGVSSVIHLAGRAHVMHETTQDPDGAYREANVAATVTLARAAVAAGVRQFIFASTVKVNGEHTERDRPFEPKDLPAPQDAYARSKLAAEEALLSLARTTSMSVVILRLPLVYGPHARGNFRRLVDAVRSRRLLPFGSVDNRRSLLGIDNLLDALDAIVDAASSIDGTHFVADADSISTPDLIRAIAIALHTKPRLVSIPTPLLDLAARLVGERAALERMTSSLEVDTSSLQTVSGWRPRAFGIHPDMVQEVADSPAYNEGRNA